MHSMVEVSRYASDEEIMEVVFHWVSVLANGDYEAFGAALGYIFEDGDPAALVRRDIESYRCPEWYPGEDSFSVTDWRLACGGNPEPRQEIIWYEPNAALLAGAITIHLPLNGKWSDLQADFVLKEGDPDCGFTLKLEEIIDRRRRMRETSE